MIKHDKSNYEIREKSPDHIHSVLHEHMDNLYLPTLPSLPLDIQSVHVFYRINVKYRLTAENHTFTKHISYLKCYVCVLAHCIRIVHIGSHDGGTSER